MSTFFSLRRSGDEDGRTAGGKIMRSRTARAAERTPYARPKPLPPPAEEPVAESSGNPNWISGLIYPARAVASGAGRIFSSVFGPDSFSSASDSEDEDDASNADEVDINKVVSSMNTKSETMRLIQQVVMQHTFSREECDELIQLIRSRVVEGDGNLNDKDVSNNAVLEARKWLEEKKNNPGALSPVTHGEISSPVDMAKSYMQAQPEWSSPAFKRVDFSTPSPMGHAKEIFRSPVQLSEMKGSALSTGSWNILDEIRKVRAKATEELLATTASKNISLPSFSHADKPMENNMTKNDNDEEIRDVLKSDTNKSLGGDATNGCRMPESEMKCEKSQAGLLQTNNDGDTTQVVGESDAGSRLSHERNGLRDSATNDHALSLFAADRTHELSKETMSGNLGPENEDTDNANENEHLFSASQDSSSMLSGEPSQDVNKRRGSQKGNDATPGMKLRPRKKGPTTPIYK